MCAVEALPVYPETHQAIQETWQQLKATKLQVEKVFTRGKV